MDTMQLTPRDLYRLRHAHLMARRAALRAQYAQQQLDELALELERLYGLLGLEAVLDLQTGKIQAGGQAGKHAEPASRPKAREEVAHGPADDARQGPS